MNPGTLTDVELLEALELAAARARLAAVDDLRIVGDVLAGLALEAAGRLRDVLELEAPAAGRMIGKVRNVTIHADGRLTGVLEVAGAGPKFLEQIKRGEHGRK